MGMRCFKCDKTILSSLRSEDNPDRGVIFIAQGNYGSEVFDPMDGSRLRLIVCDDCVKSAKHIMIVRRSVTFVSNIEPWKMDVLQQSN